MSELKQTIVEEMKAAMRSGDKARLGAIRLITAAIKQKEVDDRVDVTDADVLALLDKMAKQRRDSISQFRDAGRDDLVAQEEQELAIIQSFLPTALTEVEIAALIDDAISATGAASMQDMGKVMALIKPKAQGRADMAAVSALIKAKLTA